MALKTGMHVVFSHNVARKKLYLVFENKACTRGACRFQIPSHRLEISRVETFA